MDLNQINLAADVSFTELATRPDALFAALLGDAIEKGLVETDDPSDTSLIILMLMRGATFLSIQRAPSGVRCTANIPFVPEKFLPLTEANSAEYTLYQMSRPEVGPLLTVISSGPTDVTVGGETYRVSPRLPLMMAVPESTEIVCDQLDNVVTDLESPTPGTYIMGGSNAMMNITVSPKCVVTVHPHAPAEGDFEDYVIHASWQSKEVEIAFGEPITLPRLQQISIQLRGPHANAAWFEHSGLSYVETGVVSFSGATATIEVYLPALLTMQVNPPQLADHARLVVSALMETWIDTDLGETTAYVPFDKGLDVAATVTGGYHFEFWTGEGRAAAANNPYTLQLHEGESPYTYYANIEKDDA